MENLQELTKWFKDAYGESRDDHRLAEYDAREALGQEKGGQPRIMSMLATNPTITRARDLLDVSDPAFRHARKERGLGLAPTGPTRAAQYLGTLAGDITQDRGRELWWLINAVQAVAKEGQEMALKGVVPELYESQFYKDAKGEMVKVPKRGFAVPEREGLTSAAGTPRKGVGMKSMDGDRYYTKRRYAPGHVDGLTTGVGLATNAAVGLLTPFGGQEGYKAVFESEDDPAKTSNAIAEIGAKYILGRTGNLLNWEDFKEARPDVSKAEYNRYKAFKYDKESDFDLSDGDFTVPTGVLKGTMDGIHGPEVQFLGRSLPLISAGIPIASTLAGTTLGARIGHKRYGNAIKGGWIGGMASLAASSAGAHLIEQERRNRNMRENFPKSEAVVPELR